MSKSAVINKGAKCDIVIALVDHAFNDKKKALDDKFKQASLEVFHLVFSKKERDLIDSLPEWWLKTTNSVYLHIEDHKGEPANVEFIDRYDPKRIYSRNRNQISIEFPESIRLPDCSHYAFRNDRALKFDHPLVVNLCNISKEYETQHDEKEELRETIQAIVNGCRTFSQLWTIWPDSKTLVGHLEPPPPVKSTLPAVDYADLSKKMGLPVVKVGTKPVGCAA